MTQPKENRVIIGSIALIFVIIFMVILAILLGVTIWIISTENYTWDISNWLTLVIEVGIGVGIAFAVLIYERNQQEIIKSDQKKITQLVEQTQKITSELEKRNKASEDFHNEQRDIAIHRTRSYLASLYSVIQILSEISLDPDIPPDYDVNFHTNYELKNEFVRQLEFIANQSSFIIDQNYLQRITDIIELSRINPKVTDEEYGWGLDVSHCTGILSQIDDLLNIMPNPPV